MKKLYFISIFLLLINFEAVSQTVYTFDKYNLPFQTVASNPNAKLIQAETKIDLGFDIKVLGEVYDSLSVSQVSADIIETTPLQQLYISCVPLFYTTVKNVTGVTKIYSLVSGTPGNRINTIEYRFMGFDNYPNKFISYQIRIYEATKAIEFHYGDNNFTANEGLLNGGDSTLVNILGYFMDGRPAPNFIWGAMPYGDPINPQVDYEPVEEVVYYLNALPPTGMVYRFSYQGGTSIIEQSDLLDKYTLKTNLDASTWILNAKDFDDFTVSVLDITGREVINKTFSNSGQAELNFANLKGGVYILQVSNNVGQVFASKVYK